MMLIYKPILEEGFLPVAALTGIFRGNGAIGQKRYSDGKIRESGTWQAGSGEGKQIFLDFGKKAPLLPKGGFAQAVTVYKEALAGQAGRDSFSKYG